MNPLVATAVDLAGDLFIHLLEGNLDAARAKIEERAAIRAARLAADVEADQKFGPDGSEQ
jgi:hypothetical protein